MGRIFLSAGHGGLENGVIDPGTIAGGTTEAKEMIQLRDLVVSELRSRAVEVLAIPDDLSLAQTINWINARAGNTDVAIKLQTDSYSNPSVRGASVYYIANNAQRQSDADTLLLALLRRVPQLPSRGSKPDTATGVGSLAFCRQIAAASLLLEVGFLTNPDDRALLQSRRRDFAVGIAEGLQAWLGRVNAPGGETDPSATTYPPIDINVNGQIYDEKGILISGNSYIPIDLVDRFKIDLSKSTNVRRINYKNVVYIKAIELRAFHVSISWDHPSHTVLLRSILPICPGIIDQIMGNGHTTEVQLQMFLRANNEAGLNQFPDIAKLYREEGTIEGVNYDIAFCQMCLETTFLHFSADLKSSQNNFAALGSIGGSSESASFPSARIGVRAHIQQLKAYASTEPLVQELVAPRFRFVTRGIAPLVEQLGGRWSTDLQYGNKIMSLVKRLYESSGLL